MKNYFIILLLIVASGKVYSQNATTPPSYFGQCMLDIAGEEEIKSLEAEMRLNPYIKVVRLDLITKRAFILTKDVESLSEEQFISWFNQYSSNIRCIQIGVHGVDQVKPYPFEDCEH